MHFERDDLQVWRLRVQENILDFYAAKMETTSTSHRRERCNSMIEKSVSSHFWKSALKRVWVIKNSAPTILERRHIHCITNGEKILEGSSLFSNLCNVYILTLMISYTCIHIWLHGGNILDKCENFGNWCMSAVMQRWILDNWGWWKVLLMRVTVDSQVVKQKKLTLRQDTDHSSTEGGNRGLSPIPGDTHDRVRAEAVESLSPSLFLLQKQLLGQKEYEDDWLGTHRTNWMLCVSWLVMCLGTLWLWDWS